LASCKCDREEEEEGGKLGKAAVVGAKTGAAVGGATLGLSALMSATGFSSTGIVGGSLAAAAQAKIGAVTAGSAFAVLQSAGATGAVLAVAGPLGAAAGVVGAVGAGVYYAFA